MKRSSALGVLLVFTALSNSCGDSDEDSSLQGYVHNASPTGICVQVQKQDLANSGQTSPEEAKEGPCPASLQLEAYDEVVTIYKTCDFTDEDLGIPAQAVYYSKMYIEEEDGRKNWEKIR